MSVLLRPYTSELHYHIRWSSSTSLDWQAFENHDQAQTQASRLKRRNETYTIEARRGNCERCNELAEQVIRGTRIPSS